MPIIRIVTGSYEHNLLCVALDTSKEFFHPIFHFTPHTQSIRCLAWSKRTMVSGSNDEHIRLYDLQKRRELGTLMHHSGSVLFTTFFKNKWMFSGAADGRICIWRTKDWEILAELKGHTAAVTAITVHKSGKIALSIGDDRKCILWNLMSARKAAVRKLRDTPRKILFDVNSLANYIIAYDKYFELYNESGDILKTWKVKSAIHQIKFYNKDLMVSLDNGSILVFDLTIESTEPEKILQGHSSRVKDFDIMDNWMASVSSDGNIVVWDLEKMEQIGVYHVSDRLNCVTVVPDEVEIQKPLPIEDEGYKSANESEAPSDDEEKVLPKKKKAKVIVKDA